jgi:hypothetical protein
MDAMKPGVVAALVALVVLANSMSAAQSDGLLIFGFAPVTSASPELQGVFAPRNDSLAFRNDLADRLRNSKVRQIEVVCEDQIGAEAMGKFTYARGVTSSLPVRAREARPIRYMLTGRIETDAGLALVSGELYDFGGGSGKPAMLLSFIVDAPLDAPTEVERQWFVEQVALRVEAKFDQLTRVLIRPFTYDENDTLGRKLSTQVAELLRTRLAISPGIRILEGNALNGIQYRKPGVTAKDYNPYMLPTGGKKEAAHFVIGGSIFNHDGLTSIECYHVDVETGQTLIAKSMPPDTMRGVKFYTDVNDLGDEMRRAIEVSRSIRNKDRTRTLAVVCRPSYPATAGNRRLVLAIAEGVDRRLRSLEGGAISLPDVMDSSYLVQCTEEPQEEVAQAVRLNMQYLCHVQLQRPARDPVITLTLSEPRNAAFRHKTVGPRAVPVAQWELVLDSMALAFVDSLLEQRERPAESDMMTRFKSIRMPRLPGKICVAALPSYPPTSTNEQTTTRIVRTVETKLKVLEGKCFDYEVCTSKEQHPGEAPDYKWEVEWVDTENFRCLRMRLCNIENPYDTTASVQRIIGHPDQLPVIVDAMTEELLDHAFKGWADSCADRKSTMQGIELAASYRSIQVGLNLVGLIDNSRPLFGNTLRAALEVKAILTDLMKTPFFFGLAGEWDFGKTRDETSVAARYVSLVFRYHRYTGRDSRYYVDVCPAMFNVERRTTKAYGSATFGVILAGGMQMPFSGPFVLDLNARCMLPLKETGLGPAPPEYFCAGWATSLSVGFALMWRFE